MWLSHNQTTDFGVSWWRVWDSWSGAGTTALTLHDSLWPYQAFHWYFIYQRPNRTAKYLLYCESPLWESPQLGDGVSTLGATCRWVEYCHSWGGEAQMSSVWETVNTGIMRNIYLKCQGLQLGSTLFNFKLPKLCFLVHILCSGSLYRNSWKAVQLQQLRLPGFLQGLQGNSEKCHLDSTAHASGKKQVSSAFHFSHALPSFQGTSWCCLNFPCDSSMLVRHFPELVLVFWQVSSLLNIWI